MGTHPNALAKEKLAAERGTRDVSAAVGGLRAYDVAGRQRAQLNGGERHRNSVTCTVHPQHPSLTSTLRRWMVSKTYSNGKAKEAHATAG